jgi:hypothetical protein
MKSKNHWTRRNFVKTVSAAIPAAAWPASLWAAAATPPPSAAAQENVLVEAEHFASYGGWVLDQQFMDQMGSPYLLAHGLGEPVRDAQTKAVFPAAGEYRVWVRTRDWVAPWQAPGAPGRFQVLLNGRALPTVFGTEGADWHWQDGGLVKLAGEVTVTLHDLTGFEGRCDAILFCRNSDFQPPNELAAMTPFRRAVLGLREPPEEGGEFDLVVVGGGIAGSCAALSAARLGLMVALVQDRPVLGGNGSSEVRVWPEGKIQQPPFPRVGAVVAELIPAKTAQDGNARGAAIYADERKLSVVRAERRITLLTGQRVNEVETREGRIFSVVAQDTRTGQRVRLRGRLFGDCTGDATVGCLAGADYEVTRTGHSGASNLWSVSDPGAEALKCECTDTNAFNQTVCLTPGPVPFPRCPWAIDLTNEPFPGRKKFSSRPDQEGLKRLGDWFWESGFDRDPIADVEWMRDQNYRAMFGAWDALKNVDKLYPNHKLGWAAFIAGKRESRRLLGDVILDADDFRKHRPWPDGAFPCSWPIDLHSADPTTQRNRAGQEFIATATPGKSGYAYAGPYWAPYRCLYSRNIGNLFMAGRDISVTHNGLGPVRVMRTCGMMGEVVGMAAWLCQQHGVSPRGVYEGHLADLKALMARGVGKSTA